VTAGSPGLAGDPFVARTATGALEVFARAGDNRMWHTYQTPGRGSGWSTWSLVTAGSPGLAGDPFVARTAPGALEVFARSTDTRLWHTYQTPGRGSGWSAWSPVTLASPAITGDPFVADTPSGGLEVFARVGGGGTWHTYQTPGQGSGWAAWTPLGVGDPSAAGGPVVPFEGT
jgi:hypothetical protein